MGDSLPGPWGFPEYRCDAPQEGCVDDAGEGPVLVRSDCLTMMKVGCINDPFLIRSEDDQISVPAD